MCKLLIIVVNQKPITVQTVYSALSQYSTQWDDFAYELEVDDECRDRLEENDSLSDDEKLERIITEWVEKRTCEVSWDKIITVTRDGLQLDAQSLEKGMQTRQYILYTCTL